MSIDLDGALGCDLTSQFPFCFEPLGVGAWPLSDRLAPRPGRDSDISEGLPGEPLSPLIHTHTRVISAYLPPP